MEKVSMNELSPKELGIKAVRGKLLTAKEVGIFLRKSERWVHKHMKEGTFPIRWLLIGPRGRVVDSADLDDYLKKTFIEAGVLPVPLSLNALKAIKRKNKEKEVAR